jgi:hypothetical protein
MYSSKSMRKLENALKEKGYTVSDTTIAEMLKTQGYTFISKNWRGKPLISLAVIVSLISATTTEVGLTTKCVVDQNEYKKGIKAVLKNKVYIYR